MLLSWHPGAGLTLLSASPTIPSQLQIIAALWTVLNYIVWWQQTNVCKQLWRSSYTTESNRQQL